MNDQLPRLNELLPIDIHHDVGCPEQPLFTTRGKRGDNLLRCKPCGRFSVIEAGHVKPVSAPKPGPTPPPSATSKWRCGNHPEEPVSWRGTGCRACSRENAQKHEKTTIEGM